MGFAGSTRTDHNQDLSSQRWPSVVAALFAGALLVIPAAGFALTSIVQSYSTTKELPNGTMVSLDKNSPSSVVPATAATVNDLFGVVVPNDNAPISLTSGTGTQAQVATNGVAQMFISDINGEVKTGDSITASPIEGVGMKATTNIKIIGVAQQDLKDSSGKTKQQYTDSSKKQHDVILGQIPVNIAVSYFYKQPRINSTSTETCSKLRYTAPWLMGLRPTEMILDRIAE